MIPSISHPWRNLFSVGNGQHERFFCMFLYRASQTLFPFSILNCLFKAQGVCEVRCLKLLIKEWNIFFEVQVVF